MTYLIAARGKTQVPRSHRGRGKSAKTAGRVPTGPRHGCDPNGSVTLCGLGLAAGGFELFYKEWAGPAGRNSCPHCVAALVLLKSR